MDDLESIEFEGRQVKQIAKESDIKGGLGQHSYTISLDPSTVSLSKNLLLTQMRNHFLIVFTSLTIECSKWRKVSLDFHDDHNILQGYPPEILI